MKTKKLKTTLVFIGLVFIIQTNFSQNKVSYTYDAAGNRTSRTIVMSSAKSPMQPDKAQGAPAVLLETLANLQISVYPNPTHGLIKIDIQNLPDGETAKVNLYNLHGHLVVSKHNVKSSVEINISGKHNGIYFLKIVVGKQQSEWKIVKK